MDAVEQREKNAGTVGTPVHTVFIVLFCFYFVLTMYVLVYDIGSNLNVRNAL